MIALDDLMPIVESNGGNGRVRDAVIVNLDGKGTLKIGRSGERQGQDMANDEAVLGEYARDAKVSG